MAIIRLTQPFDAYHGTVSGQTANNKMVLFSSRRAANVARSWVLPDNPNSTLQAAIRSYLSLGATAYKGLSQVNADAWTAAANLLSRENILGLQYYHTGIGLFQMVNMYRQMGAEAIVEAVADIVPPPLPLAVDSIVATSTTALDIVADVTGIEAGGMALCRVTSPLPGAARRARSNDCRMLDATIADNIVVMGTDTCDFTLTMPTSHIVADDLIGVEITPLSAEYFPGPRLLVANQVVTAP